MLNCKGGETMEKRVNDILENAPGNKYDIYYVLSNECLSNAEEPDKILRQILPTV